MSERLETIGNATVVIYDGSHPVLSTDPWIRGTCYYGSWALDHPLTPEQISNIVGADYIWISHGHPDHLHDKSLSLLPKGKKILLPDHYNKEIANYLRRRRFDVTVLAYREWFQVSPTVRVLCMDNMNQDAMLVIEAGQSLIVDLNDSPLCGETSFLRKLVRKYPREKTYLLALCSVDADMLNFVDAAGRSLAGPPEERKPGAIWAVGRRASSIGVGNFCCSSSQHIYVRTDSIWANPYRIVWSDMQRYWIRPDIRLIEPFVTIDLADGSVTPNHPSHQSDTSQISPGTGEDDWSEQLSVDEWTQVERFIGRFELVRKYVDFIEFAVGGETRQFEFNPTRSSAQRRGIRFVVPRRSLMKTVEYGYFDDLLIGNFMKVHLINTSLYPRFTPLVAKVGGSAKVYTRAQYREFMWRYFRRNPWATLLHRTSVEMNHVVLPGLRSISQTIGIKKPLKRVYRRMLGDPV
jgi:hypothetical protein